MYIAFTTVCLMLLATQRNTNASWHAHQIKLSDVWVTRRMSHSPSGPNPVWESVASALQVHSGINQAGAAGGHAGVSQWQLDVHIYFRYRHFYSPNILRIIVTCLPAKRLEYYNFFFAVFCFTSVEKSSRVNRWFIHLKRGLWNFVFLHCNYEHKWKMTNESVWVVETSGGWTRMCEGSFSWLNYANASTLFLCKCSTALPLCCRFTFLMCLEMDPLQVDSLYMHNSPILTTLAHSECYESSTHTND